MRRLGTTAAGIMAGCGLLAAATVPGAGAGPSFALDPAFGQEGKVLVSPPGNAHEYGNAMAAFPDGSVVVVGAAVPDPRRIPATPEPPMPSIGLVPGRTPSWPSTPRELGPVVLLLRFLPDGRLDPGFGDGGRVWTDLFEASLPAEGQAAIDDKTPPGAAAAYTVTTQPDGKILVGGTTASTLSLAFALLRYHPDGTLDRTFGEGGVVVTDLDPLEADGIGALVVEPHGRIVALGRSGISAALARYTPDGHLDTSFGAGGQVISKEYREGMALLLDPAQRIVVAGQAGDSLDGPYDFAVARYLPDGRLDREFGSRGVTVTDLGSTGEFATGLRLEADGRILVTGVAGAATGIVRYLPDGTLDGSFRSDGTEVSEEAASGRVSVFLPDGRTFVGGGVFADGDRDVALSRFLPDGSLDAGFGENGVLATDVGGSRDDEAFSAAKVANGLVVTGTSYKDQTDPLVFLLRYTS